MKRYDSYKDSGVKWLGEIPSHWEMKRWRFLMNENTTKNSNCNVKLQLQFKYGDIIRKTNQSEEKDVLETISKYTVVEPNDIMINGLNLNYDFVSQRVARVREEGAITSAYVSLRPTEIADSRFYTYFLKSMDAKKMFHGMGTGIRLTLSYNELKNQFLPKPSLKEQQAIANYLDAATSKIDETIAQQQKMIDLLNERKQIIINNAVTKGLDPNVPMKDSGIKWIGMIPSNWELLPFKYILKVSKKLVGKESFKYELLSLTLKGIIKRDMNNPDGKWPASFDTYQEVTPGDFVFCNFDNEETPRAVGLSTYRGMITGAYDVMRCINQDIDIHYLIYYLLYIDNEKRFKPLYKGLRKTVPLDSLMAYKIPIPTKKEQIDIVSYLDNKLESINKGIENINKQISLLQERKQIIINDVVTGKIKVV